MSREAETRGLWPRAKECRVLRKLEAARDGFSWSLQKESSPAHLELGPVASRMELINSCCLKPPSLWSLALGN